MVLITGNSNDVTILGDLGDYGGSIVRFWIPNT